MKYKVKLYEASFKESISPKNWPTLFAELEKNIKDPKKILTGEILDNNGNVLRFDTPVDIMVYILKNKFLPQNYMNQLKVLKNKYTKGTDERIIIKDYLEKNKLMDALFTFLTKDAPSKQQIERIISEYEKKLGHKLSTDQIIKIFKTGQL